MFVTLDDVCEKGSSNLAQKDILDLDGDFPIFGAAGYIGNVNFYHQEKPYLAVVKDGAGVGRVMLLPAKSSVIGTMQYIIPKEGIIVEYLYYAVKAMHLEKYYMGAAIPHIYFKDYKKEKLMLCSKIKQEQIVARLDIIEKIINQHKQQLKNLEKFTKARFIEVFGDMLLNSKSWREIRLDSVADIVSGITKGRKIKSAELYEVPYMAVSNVKNGYIDWTKVKTIMATKEEIKRYKLLPNDVLMTEGGDPDKLGRGAIIKCPPNNCIHQNHIFRVRLNEELLPIYFEYYLQQIKAKRYFLKCSKQTTGIASINMKQLLALPVLIPDMESQKTFAKFTEQADKSKAVIEKSLKELETLQASLMQKYFS